MFQEYIDKAMECETESREYFFWLAQAMDSDKYKFKNPAFVCQNVFCALTGKRIEVNDIGRDPITYVRAAIKATGDNRLLLWLKAICTKHYAPQDCAEALSLAAKGIVPRTTTWGNSGPVGWYEARLDRFVD